MAVVDNKTKEAYVYSYEAYKELNVTPKNWLDLTTGKKFSPKDVLILNDPQDEEFAKQRNIQNFWHIQHARNDTNTAPSNNVKHSVTATRIMEQISKEKKKRNLEEQKKESSSSATSQSSAKKLKIFSHDVTGVRYTAGKASGSLTSTAMEVTSKNAIREASPEEILQAQFQIMKQRKEKGYVRLITNLGDLLVELHCDIAPRTCTNFLGLVEAKKYDGTSFHRLIPNFMVQGGKAKSGSEDASLWGPSFVDEFDDRLKHVDAGVVSMANTGPGTNKRQFFITFKSCSHLNRKHSIFGQVVDDTNGVLKKIEKQPVDTKDRPLETVKIITAEILVDPAQDALELQHEQMEEREKKRQEEETRKQAMAVGKSGVVKNKISTSTSNNKTNSRVGKYLPKSAVQSKIVDGDQNNERDTSMPMILPAAKPKAPPPTKTKFGDFSGW